jgi:mono/diheme cytochrome c family protein
MTAFQLLSVRLTLGIMLFVSLSACRQGAGSQINPAQTEVETYRTDEMSVQEGMALFNTHCASCHNFQHQEIGPSLSGITSEVNKDWLVSFIHNPAEKIKSGDERAVKIFGNFKMYMPAFAMLGEEEMENLLGFIHKFSKGEKQNRSNRKGGLLDPLAEKIPESGLTLVIEDAFQVPASSDNTPLARINKMEPGGGKGRLKSFISDLRGTIYRVDGDTVHSYLNLKSQVPGFIDQPGFATGFGSFAFHPGFQSNGLLYTTHTEASGAAVADFAIPDSIPTALQWVLSEWKTADPDSDVFTGVRRELFRIDMRTPVHGVQEIKFNPLSRKGDPDYGLLYISVGDGGASLSGQPYLAGSNKYIWGSVLRIDPAGHNSRNGKYGIPDNNPFTRQEGAIGEIWCRGFRNPNRFSWDRSGSGKMLISNIGQHSVEEINLGMAGADYGWPYREGTFLFDTEANAELVYPLPPGDEGFTYPVAQYDHDEGNAVCGGYVYAKEDIPLLKGKYIFGDIPRGTLFNCDITAMEDGRQAPVSRLNLEYQGRQVALVDLVPGERVDLRFGLGPDNTLFLLTKADGKVYRVTGCHKTLSGESL